MLDLEDVSIYKDQDFCKTLQRRVLKALKAQIQSKNPNIDNCIAAGLVEPAIKLAEMGYRPGYAVKEFKRKLDTEYPGEKPEIVNNIYKAIAGVEEALRKNRSIIPSPEAYIHKFYYSSIASFFVALACLYMGSSIFLFASAAALLCSAGLYKLARHAIKAEQELEVTGKIYQDGRNCMAVREMCSKLLAPLETKPRFMQQAVKPARIAKLQDYAWDNSMFYLLNPKTHELLTQPRPLYKRGPEGA